MGPLVGFVAMLFVLRAYHPSRKRGLEGCFESAGVGPGFLVFSGGPVVGPAVRDPRGNRTAYARTDAILGGDRLAAAIPVATVGSSVQARPRGAIRWLVPPVAVAAARFFRVFACYYAANPAGARRRGRDASSAPQSRSFGGRRSGMPSWIG